MLKDNPAAADVSPARRAMLDYVILVSQEPWAVEERHIQACRNEGWSDEAISVMNMVTCFFEWCNRIIDGFGVPMEDWWPEEIRVREHAIKSTAAGTPERARALEELRQGHEE